VSGGRSAPGAERRSGLRRRAPGRRWPDPAGGRRGCGPSPDPHVAGLRGHRLVTAPLGPRTPRTHIPGGIGPKTWNPIRSSKRSAASVRSTPSALATHDHPLRSGAGAATGARAGAAGAAAPAAPAQGSTKREDKDSLTVGSRTAVRRLARRGEDKDSPGFLIFPHTATPPRRLRRLRRPMSAFSRPSIRRLNAQPDGRGWSCGYDLQAIAADLRKREQQYPERLVSFPPKPARGKKTA